MNTVILSPFPLQVDGNSLSDQFRKVGGNPGNLVFFEALKEQLNYSEIIDTTSDVHGGVQALLYLHLISLGMHRTIHGLRGLLNF